MLSNLAMLRKKHKLSQKELAQKFIDTSKIISLLKHMREEIFAKKIATTQNKRLNCL